MGKDSMGAFYDVKVCSHCKKDVIFLITLEK